MTLRLLPQTLCAALLALASTGCFMGHTGNTRPPGAIGPPAPMSGPNGPMGPGATIGMKPPMGQMPPGQMPMGIPPMGQMPMGQMPMGQMPMGQMPMGQMPPMAMQGYLPAGFTPSPAMPNAESYAHTMAQVSFTSPTGAGTAGHAAGCGCGAHGASEKKAATPACSCNQFGGCQHCNPFPGQGLRY